MFLQEFNQTPSKKLSKLNRMLSEQFGINVKTSFPSKHKLEKVLENANMAILKLRDSNKKFQLEAEYAKFLGLREAVEVMISEGMYAESPRYMEMKSMLKDTVCELMDMGYDMNEATAECMNRYRMDSRFAYDDEYVLPLVLTAAKDYMDECGSMSYESADAYEVNNRLLRELSKAMGISLKDSDAYHKVEEKLNNFAKVSGKSREAVVGFLNDLDEAALASAVHMFGRKIAEANAFVKARRDAIRAGKKEFKVDGKHYKVTGDISQELAEAGMPSSILRVKTKWANMSDSDFASMVQGYDDDKLKAMAWRHGYGKGSDWYVQKRNRGIAKNTVTENVNVDEAEVVMALRSMSDDIQDQVERVGRMMNEDLPAIVDKMRTEMGAETAYGFAQSVNQLLSGHLEATKTVKMNLENSIAGLTGEQVMDIDAEQELEQEPTMPEEQPEEDELDVNEPAAAGPEESPLGRAEI